MFENKIYYFQEKSNEVLDLQDIFSLEEIGIYFILKAAYFKYAGNLQEESLLQKCKFFGDKTKLFSVRDKIFRVKDGMLENKNWNEEIREIKEKSNKRKNAALVRWKKDNSEDKKPNKNQRKPRVESTIEEINPIYKKLSEGLLFVLENKLQRKLPSSNWHKEIQKLIEIDLQMRTNPIDDVRRAIQTIADNYGKEYFPVIQSGSSLREKFTKIEDYVKRNNSPQKLTRDQQQALINKQLEDYYDNN
jgi:uncharacterized protein YdaU (DUF1376 family)